MLETTGLDDFNGQLLCVTITAHPKLDDETMELLCCGYEAKGDGTPNVCYFSINCAGKFTETVWLVAPIVAMIHDFAITKDWVCSYLVTYCLRIKSNTPRCYSLSFHKHEISSMKRGEH